MELIDGGVFVHDGMKEWRADGIPYGSFNGGGSGRNNPRSLDGQQYTKSPHSDDVVIDDVVNNELITKLVKERTKFKMMRQYDKADAVREGLRTKFNVLIDDRLKQWSVGGDFGEENNSQRELADKFANRGYIKSASSLSLEDEEEEAYIQFHVEARVQAKKDRNFETADKIRLDLAQRFDVVINDKMKLWSIGGVIEELGGKMGKPRGVYTRRGALGDLSPEDEDTVTKMITERYHAKKQKAFDLADEIRDELMSKYNVKIDDRSNEWRVETEDYAMAGSNSLSGEEVAFINGKLKDRFYLKRERQFEDADAIRDDLQARFGIQVDDRVKEWYVDSASSGVGIAEVEEEEDVAIAG
jgi:cysteinyl-tRNA synthetase